MNETISQQDREYLKQIAIKAQKTSQLLRTLTAEKKNQILFRLCELLDVSRTQIKDANALDIKAAREAGLSEALVDRLILNDKSIDGLIKAVKEIIALKDPVGEIIEGSSLANGLQLQKVRIPLGVVAIIYESRPNVTVDVGALGIKSGNAVILRGGKEALQSNMLLATLFQTALKTEGVPSEAVQLMEKTDRSLIAGLVRLKDEIDIVVPRGGEALIRYVTENSLIPVIKHDKGVCHVYIHLSANVTMAENILLNAKTQRPGVCNAAETAILEKEWPHSPRMLLALANSGVLLRGDEATRQWAATVAPQVPMQPLTEEGYHREYLALEISVKVVHNIEEAIAHILEYGSSHSEAIVANDYEAIRQFTAALDSSAVFVNCSTRFNDGGQFGFGAEVGIATGKLHVRGPMGLRDLTTYQYLVYGRGQIRT